MLLTTYFIVAAAIFIFFVNDAAEMEARFSEPRLHYSSNDWLLIVIGSFFWLLVICVGITYGLLFTMYYQIVDYKKKKIERKERKEDGTTY